MALCVLSNVVVAWDNIGEEGTWGDFKATKNRTVRCRRKSSPCFMVPFKCPKSCPATCLMNCNTCTPQCNCVGPGTVCQDPKFVGGDGITFYFHGKRDSDFCLVTDPSLHINAHFIGKPHPSKKRDFTWVQSIAIFLPSSDNGFHNLYLGAKKTGSWDDSVDRLELSHNSHPISLPTGEHATWQSPNGLFAVKRTQNTNSVTVESKGKFEISATVVPITTEESRVHRYNITKDDCFAHLDLSFKFFDLSERVDGVLGRTYQKNYVSKVNLTNPMPVVGGERLFATSSIFATDCVVSMFNKRNALGLGESKKVKELARVECMSGPAGTGVLCQR
ncbi:hypothetical protein LUZ60_004135 [Juncus effusus]|nr:hypothetical protein LUZ60_004135 [Juncus effusus]